MTPQKTIKWSLFPEWLQAQPAERVFDYYSCSRCVIGSFVAETSQIKQPDASPFAVDDLSNGNKFRIPEAIQKALWDVRIKFPHRMNGVSLIKTGELLSIITETPNWSPIDPSDNEPIIPAPEPSITHSTQRFVEERGA